MLESFSDQIEGERDGLGGGALWAGRAAQAQVEAGPQ